MEKTVDNEKSTVNPRVEIEYCNICNSKPQCLQLATIIRQRVPDAEVVCRTGRRGSFEVHINETLVHSKLNSLAFPDYEQVVENVQNAKEGRPVHTVAEQPITECILQ